MRITIIAERKVDATDVNSKIKWLSHSLGLLGERDTDSSCYRTFIALLNAARTHEQLSSDNLAYHLNLSRATIIHHLNKLRNAGILKAEGGKYVLRVGNLEQLIDAIRKDVLANLEYMQQVAREIDEEMGM